MSKGEAFPKMISWTKKGWGQAIQKQEKKSFEEKNSFAYTHKDC